MGSLSTPSPLFSGKKFATNAHNYVPKTRFPNSSHDVSQVIIHSRKGSFKGNSSIRNAHVAVACGGKDSAPPRGEHGALETVLKLYEAIKNKNVYGISDIISEECLCVSNFVSAFQPLLGKKQVLDFFCLLMKTLGNNIEFVVEQTSDDGMVVAVSWKLEWNKVPLPLGKGFSFYMCHIYRGKVMIKNVEIFMEPIIHIEPLRLKLISMAMTAMEKINHRTLFRNKTRRAVVILFVILFVAATLVFLKYRVST
ncbi:hypothetical protein ABFX02_13G131700 [Erythranthe guttata]